MSVQEQVSSTQESTDGKVFFPGGFRKETNGCAVTVLFNADMSQSDSIRTVTDLLINSIAKSGICANSKIAQL